MIVAGALLAMPANAEAAFPGQNGRIAFVSNRDGVETGNLDIYSMNPDGSDVVRLTNDPLPDENPAWSPDGSRIAFDGSRSGRFGVVVMNADGSGQTVITSPGFFTPTGQPSWSPDGSRIVFQGTTSSSRGSELYVGNSDGTGGLIRITDNTVSDGAPAWSPDGSKIAFSRFVPPCTTAVCNFEIFVINPDGTGEERLTFDDDQDTHPDWSPDGSKIAWGSSGGTTDVWVMEADGSDQASFSPPALGYTPAWSPSGDMIAWNESGEISVMNADGTGRHTVTNSPSFDVAPDWQPLPVHAPSSYVRPKSAGEVRVSLVPAFAPCTTPNREHGPPLAFGSCAPPGPESSRLTVGIGDGNPALANSTGFVRMLVMPGAPGPPEDSDVTVRLVLSSVMRASDLSEYTGAVRGEVRVRLTDREPGSIASTIHDFPFGFSVPCVATPGSSAEAARCTATTSVDALVPGAIKDGYRAMWELGRVDVYDGGADDDADTPSGNSRFMTQGVFVP